MALPEAIILSKCRHWRVFGTGTFTGHAPPASLSQQKLVHAFVYEASDFLGIPFGRLLWTTRQEFGELGGRVHYHWLLGNEDWKPTLAQCFVLNSIWDRLPRCGFSRNRIYNRGCDSAVDYVGKCLSGLAASEVSGGDYYESRKFSSSKSSVTLSNSLTRLIAGRLSVC